MRRKGLIAALALGASSLLGAEAAGALTRSLGELPSGWEGVASFEGDPVEAVARGGPPALLVERVQGVKGPQGWELFTSYRSPSPRIRLVLPDGPIEVPAGSLRLHLPPLQARLYQVKDRAKAPAPIRDLLDEERRPITAEMFALRARTSYHVRVSRETYHLPPAGPDGNPERRSNPVIWVSDLPFVEGRPQRPLTPAGRQHTY